MQNEEIDLSAFFNDKYENEKPEYEKFLEKFKHKKTTDDCYTPPKVYEAVLQFAVKEYALEGRPVQRPFYPGGDYERFKYAENCVVIDNPPFSILMKIVNFYEKNGIDYFLFAPGLTLIENCKGGANAVISNSQITYENGAIVNTGFVTNMGEYKIHVSAKLHDVIEEAQKKEKSLPARPVYTYPDEILTAATIQKIAKYGQELKIRKGQCAFIRTMDDQRNRGKSIFGGAMILSPQAAAEKAAAEKVNAIRWELSEREKEIVRRLAYADG